MMLHHVAVVVRNLDEVIRHLSPLLNAEVTSIKHYPNMQVSILSVGNAFIEVIQPESPESMYWDFMLKEGGLHHMSFQIENVEKTISKLDIMKIGYRMRETDEYTLIDIDPEKTYGIRIQLLTHKK